MNQTQTLPTGGTVPRGSPSLQELFEAQRLAEQLPVLDAALHRAEQRLRAERSSEGQELYFMARILRGTIHQQSSGLDDQAVEEKNAYTLSNSRFWEEYYANVDADRFDWYSTWDTPINWLSLGVSTLGSVIGPFLFANASILMLGCGRSDMSQQMYREGFRNITNVDISSGLLERLRRGFEREMPLMSWRWMNASSMDTEDQSFDVVLEKGTLDSLQDNSELFQAAVRESHRVLRSDGLFISVTDTEKLQQLQSIAPFSCEAFAGHLDSQRRLLLYVCRRRSGLLEHLRSWFKSEL
ncbi:eEF1A lysine and N-terminal methyltransferase (eEF1A-KNMT) (Methyltransferase-like protein 13) [Includes: eEF1A lysine methyltransferase [Durusdinium trenchii]|uniref:EEF1A lysine and N-terminal methyltransferase (EEF1A-KNMT) (Methyltransferase-like protein 13) n=1 Tax=Durusdinium trenchii TaxID=1381693 RepID=A0ABP0M7N2_9DINO